MRGERPGSELKLYTGTSECSTTSGGVAALLKYSYSVGSCSPGRGAAKQLDTNTKNMERGSVSGLGTSRETQTGSRGPRGAQGPKARRDPRPEAAARDRRRATHSTAKQKQASTDSRQSKRKQTEQRKQKGGGATGATEATGQGGSSAKASRRGGEARRRAVGWQPLL